MIVYPTKEVPRLGRKNIDAKTAVEAFAIYRKRFAPLADNIELTAENNDGEKFGSSDTGMVERNANAQSVDSAGQSVDGDSAGE